jgi:carboxymethylenebutenolidase
MTVRTSKISVKTADGEMGAFLAVPDTQRPVGGIVMLQEIFGVNAAMRAKAEDFAAEGFAVLVPDLFWRLEPGVELDYDEESRKKGFGLMQQYDFGRGIGDIEAAYKLLQQRPESNGKVAILGFCMGGKLAVVAGAHQPDVAAVISFYGVKLDENADQLRAISAPLVLHYGDNDAHVPIDTVKRIGQIIEDRPNAELHIYPGAQHGFFNRVRASVYDPQAAKQAFSRTVEVLKGAMSG